MVQMTALQKISRKSTEHVLAIQSARAGFSYEHYVPMYSTAFVTQDEYELIQRLIGYEEIKPSWGGEEEILYPEQFAMHRSLADVVQDHLEKSSMKNPQPEEVLREFAQVLLDYPFDFKNDTAEVMYGKITSLLLCSQREFRNGSSNLQEVAEKYQQKHEDYVGLICGDIKPQTGRSNLMFTHMTLSRSCGTIYDMAAEAIQIAELTSRKVSFEFNGVTVNVTKYTDCERISDATRTALHTGQKSVFCKDWDKR